MGQKIMKFARIAAACLAAALLSACAASAPTTGALVASQIADLSVASDAAEIDISALGPVTGGREAPSRLVAEALDRNRGSLELLSDGRPATPIVTITGVNLITTAQTLLIGGESVMSGTVALVDQETGAVIVQPVEIESGAGGYVLGGVIGAATRDGDDEEIENMAREFMRRARIALYGPNN